jgi:hypothetical protein
MTSRKDFADTLSNYRQFVNSGCRGAGHSLTPAQTELIRASSSCVLQAGPGLRVRVRMGTGAPGSRPRLVAERWRAERGDIRSLFGGSKRAGCSVKRTLQPRQTHNGEPSRSCHGEGHAWQALFRGQPAGSSRGTEDGTRAQSGPEQERPVCLACCHRAKARCFRQADDYVVWRPRRLMVTKRGRNLRAGQADAWTEEWFNGHGLYRLRGTVRYPRAA